MHGRLQGKVAVITGGSTGIGLASAKVFAEEGARVFITGRRQEALDAAVAEIGHGTVGIQGDSSRLDELDTLYRRVKDDAGRIDVLLPTLAAAASCRLGRLPRIRWMTPSTAM